MSCVFMQLFYEQIKMMIMMMMCNEVRPANCPMQWIPQQKMNCQPNICIFVVQCSPGTMQVAVDRQNRLDRVQPDIAVLYR